MYIEMLWIAELKRRNAARTKSEAEAARLMQNHGPAFTHPYQNCCPYCGSSMHYDQNWVAQQNANISREALQNWQNNLGMLRLL